MISFYPFSSHRGSTSSTRCTPSLRTALLTTAAALSTFLTTLTAIPYAGHAQAENLASNPGARIADELSTAFEQVAEVITPSVVTISTETKAKKKPENGRGGKPDPFREFFGEDFLDRTNPLPQRGLGTGVIVDDQGHILTNNHVVGDADEVTVRLSDERSVRAKVVGADPRTDLAVIKIKVKERLPKHASLGDSDKLKIGEWVVAAGASFGLDNTITAGIVSAKGRAISGGSQYEDFIQTDAAINPGNSGGPLVNLRGEVIGINTAIVSKTGGYMGIGFAIPINMARNVMNSLITVGKVTRGWLGVGIQNLTEDLAQSFNYPGTEGALVGHIDPKGPAEKSGLRQGDIIIRIGSENIRNVNQLRNYVAAIKPGTPINITVVRSGKQESVNVTIGELAVQSEERVAPDGSSEDLGFVVEEYDESSPRRPRSKRPRGVVVTEIDPNGLAAKADIQPGDVVVSVNSKTIDSVATFRDAIEDGDVKKGIRLVVESAGMERFAFLRDSNGEE
jgi:serine protease Do